MTLKYPDSHETIEVTAARRQRQDLAKQVHLRVNQVLTALAEVEDHPEDPSCVDGLLRHLETLAGEASSLGFPSITHAARNLTAAVELAFVQQAKASALDLTHLSRAALLLIETTNTILTQPLPGAPCVLIIDSTPASLSQAAEWVNSLDYGVLTATTGNEGLKIARTEQPNLILMDINLPDIDGFEVCYHLHHDPRTVNIPVVFVTARNSVKDMRAAFAVGAIDYLEKPPTWATLTDTVNRHIGDRHLLSADQPGPTSLDLRPLLSPVQTGQVLPDAPSFPEDSANRQRPPIPPPAGQPKLRHCRFEDFREHLARTLTLSEAERAGVKAMSVTQLAETTQAIGLEGSAVAAMLAEYCGHSFLPRPDHHQVFLGLLPLAFCREHTVVPLESPSGIPIVAIANPFDGVLYQQIQPLVASGKATVAICPAAILKPMLAYEPAGLPAAPVDTSAELDAGEIEAEVRDLTALQVEGSDLDFERPDQSAPLVRLVNKLIGKAQDLDASDIHIEPAADEILVRYRVDGHLLTGYRLRPARMITSMVARIKIMSGLDISERRLPQDGRIAFKEYSHGLRDFDLRVSTAPMSHGEKVVMRLIDKQKSVLPLDNLGLSPEHVELYRRKIRAPFGMVLHVGPTGSGKSMTMYAALNEVKSPQLNIVTVEDPIEYTLPGINQLQVKPGIGLTFARVLRTYLRQDPDVILVGEIRDHETAEVAVEAATTGHLLLSTLHTNDAATTILRFLEMGIEPFLVSSTLLMICAQRLVRRLCPDCKQADEPTTSERQYLGALADLPGDFFRPVGCTKCRGTGYKGRIGLHEILIPDDEMRAFINRPGVTVETLKHMAVSKGMVTLYWDAIAKVRQGICSLEDVLTQVIPDEVVIAPRTGLAAVVAP